MNYFYLIKSPQKYIQIVILHLNVSTIIIFILLIMLSGQPIYCLLKSVYHTLVAGFGVSQFSLFWFYKRQIYLSLKDLFYEGESDPFLFPGIGIILWTLNRKYISIIFQKVGRQVIRSNFICNFVVKMLYNINLHQIIIFIRIVF